MEGNFEEELVNLVHQYGLLWDRRNPDFRNRLARSNAWTTIAMILNVNKDTAEKRWNNIRNRYGKEKRKRNHSQSGMAATNFEVWPLYRLLGFLDAVIIPRSTHSNIERQRTESSSSATSSESRSTNSSSNWDSMSVIFDMSQAATSSPSEEPPAGRSDSPQPGPSNAPQPGPSNAPQPGPSNAPQPGPFGASQTGRSNKPPSQEPQPGPSHEPQPGGSRDRQADKENVEPQTGCHTSQFVRRRQQILQKELPTPRGARANQMQLQRQLMGRLDELMDFLKQDEADDDSEDANFFRAVSQAAKRLKGKKKTTFKARIMNLLDELLSDDDE